MKSIELLTANSIRFRRWSRAGYAIFCSLAASVTIGCVAISISDKSLQKSVGTSTFSICGSDSESASEDKLKELEEKELTIRQLQEAVVFGKTFESAAACSLNIYFLLIRTVEMSESHFNRFLFYSV